jgi:hypothetical protein
VDGARRRALAAQAGFSLIRSKGIGRILHPKIVRQVELAIQSSDN